MLFRLCSLLPPGGHRLLAPPYPGPVSRALWDRCRAGMKKSRARSGVKQQGSREDRGWKCGTGHGPSLEEGAVERGVCRWEGAGKTESLWEGSAWLGSPVWILHPLTFGMPCTNLRHSLLQGTLFFPSSQGSPACSFQT
jgi:hypothetical protein